MGEEINEMKKKPLEDIQGEQTDLKNFADKEVIFEKIVFLQSKYKEDEKYCLIQFRSDGKEYSSATGSQAVVESLEFNKDNLPFKATLKKVKSASGREYYVLE